MSRIRKFYEARFRSLAVQLGNAPDTFAAELFSRADELQAEKKLRRDLAWAMVLAKARSSAGETKNFPRQFLCDAGLGGLARWLRAAGYDANWNPQFDDAALIREAMRIGATLVTSDTLMMERGVLRDGLHPSVCVPSSLTCEEQLAVLFRELDLEMREPRCMACGGELRRVPKETVAGKIPPRTALWLDEYFLCSRCGQLFWRGTHWRKIARELERVVSRSL